MIYDDEPFGSPEPISEAHPWYGPCDALGQNGRCVECALVVGGDVRPADAPRMPDPAFRALLDLLVESERYFSRRSAITNNSDLIGFADSESKARGYDSWIVAFHEFEVAR